MILSILTVKAIMMLVSLLVFGLLGSLADGSPLEKPSENLENYFDSRIVGGVDAPEGFAIYMAGLIAGDRLPTIFCGASILTEVHMLTAAHCIDSVISNTSELLPSFHARVGSNKWNSGGTLVDFENYHIHPDWNPNIVKNDIALLVTSNQLKFTPKVGPIAMSFDWVDGGEDTHVTGWGRTGPKIEGNVVHLAPTPDDLQLLHKQTVNSDECISNMEAQGGYSYPIYPAIEICTYHSRGHGVCNGDSGSALVSETSNKLIGIVSWGYPCAIGAPDVFARLSAFSHFLNKHLKLNI